MHVRELFSLKAMSAVVIGGAGKIGSPMSEALAEAGASVFVASTRPEAHSARIKQLCAQQDLDIRLIRVEQSDEASVKACISEVTRLSKSPSILVNCGVERPMKNYFDDTTDAWDRSMNVNARGLFITCRAFSNEMAREGGGSIINVASVYGIVAPDWKIYEGTDIQTEPDYPYTKGGMIMFSKYLASMFASKNVRVNCIAPGGLFNHQPEPFYSQYVRKVPMGRMAYPDDLKGVAVFLASPASSYITGTVIPVDGGFTVT